MDILYRISRILFLIFLKCFHSLKVLGKENLPKKGPFICVSNHISIADPVVIGVACSVAPVDFMAKEELFSGKRWGWWIKTVNCILIRRDGKDFAATKEAIRRLKSGRVLGVFPEGTRSVTGQLQEPEAGVGFIVSKSGVPVVPMYISGTDKVYDGGKYRVGRTVSAYIGKIVDFGEIDKKLDKREKYSLMSKRIMQEISKVRDGRLKK